MYIKSLPRWKPDLKPHKWVSPMTFYSWGLKTGNPQWHSKAIQLRCHGDSWGVSDLHYYLKSRPLPCVLPPSSSLILRSHQALKVQHALESKLPFLIFLPVEGIFKSGHTHIIPLFWALPAHDLRSSFCRTLWILIYTCIAGSPGCSALWHFRSTHVSAWSF